MTGATAVRLRRSTVQPLMMADQVSLLMACSTAGTAPTVELFGTEPLGHLRLSYTGNSFQQLPAIGCSATANSVVESCSSAAKCCSVPPWASATPRRSPTVAEHDVTRNSTNERGVALCFRDLQFSEQLRCCWSVAGPHSRG